MQSITINKYGKGFAIFAGKSRLSQKFKTEAEAVREYESNNSLYQYWADSAGVSIENTPAVVKRLN